jgi:hypothetical protein
VCARACAAVVAARALPARADAPPAYTCSETVAAAVLCCYRVRLAGWQADSFCVSCFRAQEQQGRLINVKIESGL